MSVLPGFLVTIDTDYPNHYLSVNISFDDKGIEPVYNILDLEVDINDRYSANLTYKIIIENKIKYTLNYLMQNGYIIETNNGWKFLAVRYVLDSIGINICRYYDQMKNYSTPDIDFHYNVKDVSSDICLCLIDINNGELIDDLKAMPVELISDLKGIFKREEFNLAVDKFSDSMILDLANIPGDS